MPVSAILVASILSAGVEAGQWTPDEGTLRNIASTAALHTLCAMQGHAEKAPVTKLLGAYETLLTPESWVEFNVIYKRSTSDRLIWNDGAKVWYRFEVGAEHCEHTDATVEMFLLKIYGEP